jgi:peptidoglycan/LPS O-acetylase OafA/YrhL
MRCSRGFHLVFLHKKSENEKNDNVRVVNSEIDVYNRPVHGRKIRMTSLQQSASSEGARANVVVISDKGYAIDTVLECCRGAAAMWVFMFHVAEMFKPISLSLYKFAACGHNGVPLFFAISGYCMFASAETTVSKQGTALGFLRRRLLRVLPPFWLSVLVVIATPFVIAILSAAKSGRYEWPHAAWMVFTVTDWIQVLTLTRAIFKAQQESQAAYSPVNAVYWTLAIELQFYVVMAFALHFKQIWRRIVVAVLCLSIFTFAWNSFSDAIFLRYWPAFTLGMALRVLHLKEMTPARAFGRREAMFSLAGAFSLIVSVLICLLYTAPLRVMPNELASFEFTGVALVSIILLWFLGGVEHGIRTTGRSGGISRAAFWALLPLCWVGQSSYSLYLLHGKIYQLPAMVVRQFIPEQQLLYPMLTIILTAMLCFAFYTVAERPFQHGGRLPLSQRHVTSSRSRNKRRAL